MNTADEILQKHEDANEMHFHEVDRKFIIEAMEEYAAVKSEKPINLEFNQTAVQWLIGEFKIYLPAMLEKGLHAKFQQALEMERKQIEHAYDFGNSRIGLSSYGIADGSDYYSNLYDTEE